MQIALLEELYNGLPAITGRHWFFFVRVISSHPVNLRYDMKLTFTLSLLPNTDLRL